MILLRIKHFTNYKVKKYLKKGGPVALGLAGAAGLVGAKKLSDSIRLKDRLAGRKILYHGTRLNNLESIYDKGIQGSKTDDPSSLTYNDVAKKDSSNLDKFRNLVYTTSDKKYADFFGDHRDQLKAETGNYGTYGKTLTISIPRKEYSKLKKVENPEFKDYNDYISGRITKNQLANRLEGVNYNKLNSSDRRRINKSIPMIKSMVTIRGDIKPEWIVGSSKYKKPNKEEIIDNLLGYKKVLH